MLYWFVYILHCVPTTRTAWTSERRRKSLLFLKCLDDNNVNVCWAWIFLSSNVRSQGQWRNENTNSRRVPSTTVSSWRAVYRSLFFSGESEFIQSHCWRVFLPEKYFFQVSKEKVKRFHLALRSWVGWIGSCDITHGRAFWNISGLNYLHCKTISLWRNVFNISRISTSCWHHSSFTPDIHNSCETLVISYLLPIFEMKFHKSLPEARLPSHV